jgi:hypothetical protein
MKNKNFIGRLRCLLFLMALASFNYLSAQTGPNDDFDGDGIINSIDIDDDNDGVPDAMESPSCFYSASEWNTSAKPTTNGVTITSALTTTLGNFGQLLDNVPATTAVTFTAGQPIQNANVYLFTFAQAVRLDAVYLKFNTLTQFGGTTKIQGSNTNNGSDWVDLSAATSTVGTNVTNGLVEVTNSIKYPVTLNTATSYRYIRITGVAVSNTAAQNSSEVYFDFNVANYVASHYPKATCTDANIDGDGILPQFDLDSDGDGCSDAYEAGATTNLATNYKFTGAVGVNGLDNTLETSDNGIINYASTYYVYAQNSAMQICKDTDGDGILDINDIDDDNDGVLDTAEQVVETCSGVFTADSRVIWNSTFTNSNTTATGNATINGTPVSVTANTTKVFNDLKDDHWHYGSGTYVGCPDVTTVVSNSVINLYSNDYTVTYTFSRPVRNPSLSFSSFNGTAVLFPQPVYVSGLQGTVAGVSSNSYITSFPATENTVAVIYNGVYNSISFRVAGSDAQGSVLLNIPYVLNAGSLTYTLTSGSPFGYLDIDTDGDGIVNRLDLDSDGDGCPDAREAGVSSNAGASASMSASGGSIYTGGIPSGTANAYVGNGTPSQYNANGFFNGIETAAESGVYNGTYAYSFATSAALNLCIDTDGDGVGDFVDIDDDNDGVVDAVESPSCFYTANEWNTGAKPFYGVTISSGLTTTTGNFSQLIDGVSGTTAVAFSASPTQAIANANVYLFNFAQPVKLDALYLQFNTATQFGGTTKIQGSNTNNGSDWVDLSAAIGAAAGPNTTVNGGVSVTTSIKYPVTLNTATAYKYIRITGVAASNIVAANASEVYFDFNNASYIASSYPKTTCVSDTDGDGIPNHRDLDSDGDGCPDAVEASVSANPGATGAMSTSGGSIYTGGIPSGTANAYVGNGTPGQYSSNGLFNDIETGENGIYNKVYTYPFAVSTAYNLCADSDGDGIGDLVDIDDDNDGVQDAVESPACFYTANEWNTTAKPISGVTISSGLTTTAGNFSQLLDGVGGTTAVTFTANQAILNANVYLFTFVQPVRLDALYLKFNTATQFVGNTKIQGSNTNNGSDWVDLSANIAAGAGTNTAMNGGVSITNSIRYPITLNATNSYKYIRITGVAGATTSATAQNASEVYFDFSNLSYVASYFPKATCTTDTDGDGKLNHLDLDSDGDGCSDALESGATTITTANYQFTGNVGVNGLDNTLETSDNGIINYTSTYNAYALVSTINACADTDGDGVRDVIDVDDDNDGVLDGVELGCSQNIGDYLAANGGFSVYKYALPTGTLTTSTAAGNTAWGTYVFDDKTQLSISAKYLNATNAASISFGGTAASILTTQAGFSNVIYHNATTSEPDNNVTIFRFIAPTNFNLTLPSVGASGDEEYAFVVNNVALIGPAGLYNGGGSSQSGGPYAIKAGDVVEFRYRNVTPVAQYGNATLVTSGGYFCSSFTLDTDGDGIPNHLDLDSDGDGCPDAKEASVSVNTGASGSMSTSGGAIYTGGIPSGTANAYVGNGTPSQYGTNGFFNGIETAVDSNLYNSTYTYQYAINNTLNACTDTDGDGVGDLIDIDDDNDGILDITEAQCATPIYTSKSGVTVSSTITWNGALSLLVDGADTANQTYPNGVAIAAQTVLQFDLPSAKALKQIELSAYSNHTAIVVGAVVQMQGWNGVSWENIGSQITVATPTTGIANPAQLSYKFSMPANLYSFNKYRIYGVSGNVQANWLQEAYFSEICVNNDTDGDGIPNILDLDSDGDGCPDALEAGVSTNAGASASMSASGGTIYTGGIPSGTANAYIGNGTPSQYGTNGFFNGVETTADSGLYNGTYTYPFATSVAINLCADTDGDGINDFVDIDDDNDGVVDAVESPTCFYTANEWNTGAKPFYGVTISSGLTTTTGNFSQLIDGVSGTAVAFSASPTQAIANANVYLFNFAQPVKLDALYLQFNTTTTQFGNTTKIQGSNTNNGSDWVDLSAAIGAGAATNVTANGAVSVTTSIKYPVTLNTATAYKYIRITGVAASNIAAANASEVYFDFNNASYIASSYPKTTCVSDTDGDLIPNHRDLDSDGDGCSDAVEAGNTVFTSNNITTYNTGTDTNGNGLLNQFESTTTPGTINYTSTYATYAINSAINACTDTDGDLVPDIVDIDDDNDGVLDTVEMVPVCNIEAAVPSSVTVTPSTAFGPIGATINNSGMTGVGLAATTTGPVTTGDAWYGPDNVTTATIDYVTPNGTNASYVLLWATESSDGTTGGDGPVKDFTVTITYNNGASSFTTKTFTTIQPTGIGTPNYAQKFDFGQAFTNVTKITLNVLNGWYDSDTPAKNDGWVPTNTVTISTQYNLTLGEFRFGCYELADQDTDNDGIPNRLDLDSDGDGCPDTKEAILYNHVTEASIAGDVKNGSGGAVTSMVNTPNAMVPGPYGSNGFADALQLSTNPDAYKYVYTYNFVADNVNVSTCDNKFLYDIDSDDDGIPDAVESPSCFYTETQAMNITEGVTSDFAWAAANPLSNTYDDNTTYGAVTPAANIQNKALITFDLPVIDAAFIDYVQLNVGATAFGTGTWRLEGLDVNTNLWVSLSAAQAMNNANSNYVFTNTLQSNTRYHTYRILGVTSVNVTNNAALTEFSIHYKNYNPSFHRTKMGCNSDGDNDGVPDYLDRDSDGDGCPDAVEAGISKSLLVPGGFFNTGGQVMGDYVTVGGNYGDNGISDLVETTPDSGIINYASTYHLYANNAAVNFCTDTDNDGVPDPIDIDDDNDGVLDAVESPSCFYTVAEANVIYRINSQFASPDDDQSDRDIQMLHDGSTALNFNFNAFTVVENATGSNLFTVEYFTPVRLATLVVSNRISTTANANAVVVGSQDGVMWSAALTPATLITAANATTPITFTITTAVPYKFYKIQTGSVPGALATANTIGEITSTLASGYIPSAHPKSEICLVDTDGDLIPNHLDNDSDNDGCSDAFESGTVAYASANGGTFSAGTLNNPSSTLSPNATVGSNTPADYGANGFYNILETSENGVYLGTYTYANVINALISNCSTACYKPAATGIALDTHHGITSLQRAGTDNSGWPMVRKGAWTALESKTKAFVPNRLTITEINSIPAANLKEGMMVYNICSNFIYIITYGTATGWKCFNTQACP